MNGKSEVYGAPTKRPSLPELERRTRCDAARPKCGGCSQREVECIYQEQPVKTEELAKVVTSLEDRISQLQNANSDPRNMLSDPTWTPEGWWETEEPPVPLRNFLFETFMKFTTTLGVFLHSERLRRSFYTLAPFGSPSRPSPALVSAIYLWGIVISGSPALINYQSVFLSRAIYHSTTSGQTLHPPLTRHTVQAELLITCYLFHIGLGAEGKAHSDAALRLALSENIHKVRGTEIPNLSSLTDSIDLGERMNAAWMSFLTDACISSIHGFPTALPNQDDEQGRIDMPWPLDMAQYDKGLTLPETSEGGTLANFINSPVFSYGYEEISFLAMECKAAELLKRTSVFTASWDPTSENETLYMDFLYLNQRIDRFLEKVSPVVAYDKYRARRFQLILVHSLAHLASINLNVSPVWTGKSVNAAAQIVHLLDNFDFRELRFLHPIMGDFWRISGDVLIAEYDRLQGIPANNSTRQDLDKLKGTLKQLEKFMAFYSTLPTIEGPYRLLKNKCRQLGVLD